MCKRDGAGYIVVISIKGLTRHELKNSCFNKIEQEEEYRQHVNLGPLQTLGTLCSGSIIQNLQRGNPGGFGREGGEALLTLCG